MALAKEEFGALQGQPCGRVCATRLGDGSRGHSAQAATDGSRSVATAAAASRAAGAERDRPSAPSPRRRSPGLSSARLQGLGGPSCVVTDSASNPTVQPGLRRCLPRVSVRSREGLRTAPAWTNGAASSFSRGRPSVSSFPSDHSSASSSAPRAGDPGRAQLHAPNCVGPPRSPLCSGALRRISCATHTRSPSVPDGRRRSRLAPPFGCEGIADRLR